MFKWLLLVLILVTVSHTVVYYIQLEQITKPEVKCIEMKIYWKIYTYKFLVLNLI